MIGEHEHEHELYFLNHHKHIQDLNQIYLINVASSVYSNELIYNVFADLYICSTWWGYNTL